MSARDWVLEPNWSGTNTGRSNFKFLILLDTTQLTCWLEDLAIWKWGWRPHCSPRGAEFRSPRDYSLPRHRDLLHSTGKTWVMSGNETCTPPWESRSVGASTPLWASGSYPPGQINTGKASSSKQPISALTTYSYSSPTSPNTDGKEKGASPWDWP